MSERMRIVAAAVGCGLLVVLVGGWASPVEGADCLIARVPNDFVLPDGSKHGPSKLRICRSQMLNPAVELDQISVDGDPVGIFQAKTLESDGDEVLRPVFYFAAGADTWKLVGLAEPSPARDRSPRSVLFADARRVKPRIRSEWRISDAGAVPGRLQASDESLVVVVCEGR